MAKGYGGDPVRTQEELTDAGRPVPEAGRKGGAVAAADYDEGPARVYDATAATSQKTGLSRLLPLIVIALFAGLLIWAAVAFRPSVSPAGAGQTAPSSRGAGEVQDGKSDRGTPGFDAGN